VPTNRKYLRRSQRAPISSVQEMELWMGPSRHGSAFASEAQRREAWFRHRERLMAWWGQDGRRPLAWWAYEAPEGLKYPGYDYQRPVLYEAGVLSAEERARLEAYWREEFDRSWDPHFFHCAGPGKIFKGDAARVKHWLWMDLPLELHDRWMAEREQGGQAVCWPAEEEGAPEHQEAAEGSRADEVIE